MAARSTRSRKREHPHRWFAHLTTATTVRHDPLGFPLTAVSYAQGIEQRTTWTYDGAHRVLREQRNDGFETTLVRDLLGRPRFIQVQRKRDPGAPRDVAELRYNGRGQVTEILDPAGQRTELVYDGFGALRSRSLRGQPAVGANFSYDDLGRLDIASIGGEQIKHEYDDRGDLVGQSVQSSGVWAPLVRRQLDELGRLRHTENVNPVLSLLLPEPERTVTHDIGYDTLGRIEGQKLGVGTAATQRVLSQWSLTAGDTWVRTLSYPTPAGKTEWVESYDVVGRLAQKSRRVPGGTAIDTAFRWLGDLYLGRDQQQAGRPSPFRERLDLDPFGLEARRRYTAIDLDVDERPLDPAEGQSYCGGTWERDCVPPLLDVKLLRDSVGRVASLQWGYGHPRFSGGTLVPGPQPTPWRGYAYTPRRALNELWEHAGETSTISTAALRSYAVTRRDLEALGSTSEHWTYEREEAVGGTVAIGNTTATRWSLPLARGAGHQLRRVLVDGMTREVTHDAAGRVVSDGRFTYIYDARGQLAAALQGGALVEAYAYDANGRLAAVFNGNVPAPPTVTFTYDGAHVVAAFDATGRLAWEAAWGPRLDQLLEWRDYVGATGDHLPLCDHRNSVVATWNATQARLTQTVEYSPEGRLILRDADGQIRCKEEGTGLICANPAGSPFGLLSAWRSPATGHVFLRNRWYSPELGQFLSHDPLGYVDSFNLYAYAAFDPVNRLDPLGLGGPGFPPPSGEVTPPTPPLLPPNPQPSQPPSQPPEVAAAASVGLHAANSLIREAAAPIDASGRRLTGALRLWSDPVVGKAAALEVIREEGGWLMGQTPQHRQAANRFAQALGREGEKLWPGLKFTRDQLFELADAGKLRIPPPEFRSIWDIPSGEVAGKTTIHELPVSRHGTPSPSSVQIRIERPVVTAGGLLSSAMRAYGGAATVYSGFAMTEASGNPVWIAAGTTFGVLEATGGIMYAAGAFGGSAFAMSVGAGVAVVGGVLGIGLVVAWLIYVDVTNPNPPGEIIRAGNPEYHPSGNRLPGRWQ